MQLLLTSGVNASYIYSSLDQTGKQECQHFHNWWCKS